MSQLSHLDASSCDSNRNGHKSEADAANGSQTGRDIDLSSPFGHQCVFVCVRALVFRFMGTFYRNMYRHYRVKTGLSWQPNCPHKSDNLEVLKRLPDGFPRFLSKCPLKYNTNFFVSRRAHTQTQRVTRQDCKETVPGWESHKGFNQQPSQIGVGVVPHRTKL